MRKTLITAVLIYICILTVSGCAQDEGQSVSIQFGELWDSNFNVSERIAGLEGERVSMTGFMAMQSPLDGSFIYLTNAPMVSCPYCIPGTNTPVFAIPAIAPSRRPINFTDQPVTITGKLEVEEKIDEFGYTTPFRINVESLSIADADKMPQSLRDYSMLTADGVTTEITGKINRVYNLTTGQSDISVGEVSILQPIDTEKINALISRVNGYGISSFDPLSDILQDLIDLSTEINGHIQNNDEDKLTNYSEEALSLWDAYFDWANEMAAME